MKKEKKSIYVSWKSCIKICICALAVFLLVYYWEKISEIFSVAGSAAAPIIIGFVIAYVLNILMCFYERHYFPKLKNKNFIKKSKRPVCMIGAIITMIGIVTLIVILVVPELISCVTFLVSEIPPLIVETLETEWVQKSIPVNILSSLSHVDWMSYVSQIIKTLVEGIGSAVDVVISAVTGVVSAVITLVLSIIFSVYFLSGRDRINSQLNRVMKSYLSEKVTGRITYTVSVIDDSFHRYIVGQCTEAVILGVLCTLGMFLFRFPYAPMIGALVGFTALIPVAGAYIGAGVGAVMILTESPLKALLFLVFILVLQQLEGNIIYPKVVGDSVGLPAIWVLAAVTVGGALGGILGMLIGVPVVAAIYRLIREDVERREAFKLQCENTESE